MTRARTDIPILAIAGWKNSGKTTLVERIVSELSRRGYRVATIKHAHHAFQIDNGTEDSARHRRAGAQQVAIVSSARWALIRELASEPEPTLADIIAKLDPADLILVEGYKSEPISKIEVRRVAAPGKSRLADSDPHVVALATDGIDTVTVADERLPRFALDDVAAIADFIVAHMRLRAVS